MEHAIFDSICVILRSLRRVCEDFVCSLNGLKLGVEFELLARIAIRVVFESYVTFKVSLDDWSWGSR